MTEAMPFLDAAAAAIVSLAGIYLLVLGAVSLFWPSQATRFLLGFAGSAWTHYSELLARAAVGAALLLHAPQMLLASVFAAVGWVLLATTAALLLVPWRWHRRFAAWAVPQAIQHIALIGLASLAMGGIVLAAVIRGGIA